MNARESRIRRPPQHLEMYEVSIPTSQTSVDNEALNLTDSITIEHDTQNSALCVHESQNSQSRNDTPMSVEQDLDVTVRESPSTGNVMPLNNNVQYNISSDDIPNANQEISKSIVLTSTPLENESVTVQRKLSPTIEEMLLTPIRDTNTPDSQDAPTQVFPEARPMQRDTRAHKINSTQLPETPSRIPKRISTPRKSPRHLPKTPIEISQKNIETLQRQTAEIEKYVCHIPEILAFMESQSEILAKSQRDLKLSQKINHLQEQLQNAHSQRSVTSRTVGG